MFDLTADAKGVPAFLGSSPAAHQIRREILRAAKSDAKVLITGESGVGKEVVARSVHAQGRRSHVGLITMNCAGVPDTMLEAELFGYVRGSFTDAYRDSPGVLSLASGGTLFMDEVGEMSARMQALLLRFFDSGEIHRLGSHGATQRADVRIIAATNRSLPERIAAGEFRPDLYYRLNVIHLHVPPLRERREDILALFDSFMRRFATRERIPVRAPLPDLARQLVAYHWPGNVRELRNVAERMVLQSDDHVQDLVELLPSEPRSLDTGTAISRQAILSEADDLFQRMTRRGETFWPVVHTPFLARDITRDHVRHVIRQGLMLTKGNYKELVDLFNMPFDDYRRFLSFLRKYDCQLRFQDFRARVRDEESAGADLACVS